MRQYLDDGLVTSFGALFDHADHDHSGEITHLELLSSLEVS